MKAVKLYNIEWSEPGNPETLAYRVKDDMTVPELCRSLSKKYGCRIESMNYHMFHIPVNISEFLEAFHTGTKQKPMFTDSGKLTAAGKSAFSMLDCFVGAMTGEGSYFRPSEEVKDRIVCGFETLTGNDWGERSKEEVMRFFYDKVKDMKPKIPDYLNKKSLPEMKSEK